MDNIQKILHIFIQDYLKISIFNSHNTYRVVDGQIIKTTAREGIFTLSDFTEYLRLTSEMDAIDYRSVLSEAFANEFKNAHYDENLIRLKSSDFIERLCQLIKE